MAESVFATLECELLARRRFATHAGARVAIPRYVEGWYNAHRRHSALGYQSPITDGARLRGALRHRTARGGLDPKPPALH